MLHVLLYRHGFAHDVSYFWNTIPSTDSLDKSPGYTYSIFKANLILFQKALVSPVWARLPSSASVELVHIYIIDLITPYYNHLLIENENTKNLFNTEL